MIKGKIKRGIMTGLSAVALSFMLTCSCDMASHASEAVVVEQTAKNDGRGMISPYSAMIEWRYKIIDGVLYRRLFNYTEQCWVGDWEVCPLK